MKFTAAIDAGLAVIIAIVTSANLSQLVI